MYVWSSFCYVRFTAICTMSGFMWADGARERLYLSVSLMFIQNLANHEGLNGLG